MSHRIHDPAFLAARFRCNGSARDSSGHGNHGTLVNAPTWGVFNKGLKTALELDGDDAYVSLGTTQVLSSVSAFTLCGWVNQNVIGTHDRIFFQHEDGDNNIILQTDGGPVMEIFVENGGDGYGSFDYSTVVSAHSWHHVAVVFDGSQATNATRLLLYIDGVPMALAFTGTIQATTPDLTGDIAVIGTPTFSFDGRLYDFRIYSVPLSRQEIMTIQHEPVGVL